MCEITCGTSSGEHPEKPQSPGCGGGEEKTNHKKRIGLLCVCVCVCVCVGGGGGVILRSGRKTERKDERGGTEQSQVSLCLRVNLLNSVAL